MDSTHEKAATSHPGEPSTTTSPPAHLETKALRSSARVKAAKQKERQKERPSAEQHPATSSAPAKRPREPANAKGKGKETDEPSRPGKRCVHASCYNWACLTACSNARARRAPHHPISAPLTINEPAKDPKGKKRAVPDEPSDGEGGTSISAPAKRTRTTSTYSLRSRDTATTPDMPKKTR